MNRSLDQLICIKFTLKKRENITPEAGEPQSSEGDEEADGCSTLYSRPRLVSYEQEEDKNDMLDNCLPHL